MFFFLGLSVNSKKTNKPESIVVLQTVTAGRLLTFKGQCHKIFDIRFYHQITSSGPVRDSLEIYYFWQNFAPFNTITHGPLR